MHTRLLPLLTCALLTAPACAVDQLLDAFDYPDDAAAQASWTSVETTPPLGIMPLGDHHAVRINADFTGESRRAAADLKADWDLSLWDRFTLDVYLDDPGLFGSFTLYFQSKGGWYGAGLRVNKRGWQTIGFTRSAFGTEDSPAGWDQITGLRFAGWRGAPRTGFCAVANLHAYREDRVVVVGTNSQAKTPSEWKSVQNFADSTTELLAAAGIPIGAITDTDVENGALEGRKLAVFPYNPSLSESEVDAIKIFVEGGGKVFVCYQAPPALRELLGFKNYTWQHPEGDARLATIQFGEAGFEGLPAKVGQDSWCCNVPQLPLEAAQVVGNWHNAAGQDTGWPAVTLNDHGVFYGHVILTGDGSAKRQMLLALLGRLDPEIWSIAASTAIAGPARLGLCDGRNAALIAIRAKLQDSPYRAELTALMQREADLRAQAEAKVKDAPAAAVALATQADEVLREAYLKSLRSRAVEMRAVWNHSGTGAFETWDESMRDLKEHGLNAIMPNVLWGGVALYESEYLPHAKVVAEKGDQLAECVAAGKKYGIEVHPWKVNWNLGRTTEEFKAQLAAEDRLQADVHGETVAWLEPSDPRNLELEVNTMVEMARKYDVDGVHFDYIRYPGFDNGYSEAARRRFEESIGQKVENWPEDVYTGALKPQWVQWRCDNISKLVQRVSEEVHRIKPNCRVSAAVFSSYPNCRVQVSQDWAYWIQQGWLDFVCPMDYTESDSGFANTITNQLSHLAGRIPICPGIGATASRSTLTSDRVAGQIEITREIGADGFTIFNYSAGVSANVLPGLRLGVLKDDAVVGQLGPDYTFDLGPTSFEKAYGRAVVPDEELKVTITPVPPRPGVEYQAVSAKVMLEDAHGEVVKESGNAPVGRPLTITLRAPARGLYRVVVRGEATLDGRRAPFVQRSLPLLVEDLAPEMAGMFGR